MQRVVVKHFRWLPRLAALVIAGGFLAIAAGEFINPHSGPPTKFIEWLGIALCATACLSPLLAFKWELEGALLSLAALAAFAALIHFRSYSIVALMSVPALLYLTDLMLRRTLARSDQSGSR
ncbi:MAG: hypothetical protein HY821_17785 [Acidobacteria bacterium]|nr:hypothetical protein [Acidobacteriota bacterium]